MVSRFVPFGIDADRCMPLSAQRIYDLLRFRTLFATLLTFLDPSAIGIVVAGWMRRLAFPLQRALVAERAVFRLLAGHGVSPALTALSAHKLRADTQARLL